MSRELDQVKCVQRAEESSPECRYKHTPRDKNFQHEIQSSLNRVIGQLNGVKSMIDDNRYCGDVLTQLAASERALSSISRKILHNHMETCVVEEIQDGNTEVIDEVMSLIKNFS
ncbi:MAG: metal-sensing transcriptional repressor [Eggerthellaceae bacterium]|jgi:DNA-binding FrmR family transcriptional regulator